MRPFGGTERAWRWTPVLLVLAAAPAAALQVLQAVDHAELTAEVSSSEVNRIALEGDRIARVVRSPGAYTLEHDPVGGDLYLYPGAGSTGAPAGPAGAPSAVAAGGPRAPAPVTLYLGTERGMTYRLTLTPVQRASAQILIRNAEAAGSATPAGLPRSAVRESAIVALIGAVARREPLPGYAVDAAPDAGEWPNGIRPVETWRGPGFAAYVLAVPGAAVGDAEALAALAGPNAIAAWLEAGPGGAAHGGAARGSPARGSAAGSGSGEAGAAAGPASMSGERWDARLGVVVAASGSAGSAP